MTNSVTKYFGWDWSEVPSEEGAAFAETWTYDEDGSLLTRKRVDLEKNPGTPTISTDPRAADIMRESVGFR